MLEKFIADYSDKGYQFAFHLCGNPEDARELVQEAFYRVIRKWDEVDPAQNLECWFMTILRNLYYDGVKRFDRRLLSLDMPAEADDPQGATLADAVADARDGDMLERLERGEAADRVNAALAALSPEHRAILVMCDMQGLGYEEISAVLDCPLGTVRSRIYRARAAFKNALGDRFEEVMEK